MGSVDIDPTGFSGTLDDIDDGSTYKKMSATEQTKLTGIEEGADVNVGEEFTTTEQTKLSGIADNAEVNPADLAELDSTAADKLAITVTTAPTVGQHKVETIQRKPTGEINFIFNDTPES